MEKGRFRFRHGAALVVIASVVAITYVILASTVLSRRSGRQRTSDRGSGQAGSRDDVTPESAALDDTIGPLHWLPTHRRAERCRNCFRPRFNFTIAPTRVCQPTEIAGTVDVIALVYSDIRHRSIRDVIRKTWASVTRNNTAIVRHVFVFGTSSNTSDNKAIFEESMNYGDIVQQDFLDTYANLTLKTMAALKWVTKHCTDAKYVLKTDDDMWVNMKRLLWVLPRYDLHHAIGGSCLTSGSAVPIRDTQSKWYASYDSYPASRYPGFCTGTGYIMEMQTAMDILNVSPHVPFFHLEDVYVALCVRRLRYRLQNLPGFHNDFVHFNACVYRRMVVTSHEVTMAMIAEAWNANCSHPFLV